MAKKSMMFMMSLKKCILLGALMKRMMSSNENQQMQIVSTMKNGSWKAVNPGETKMVLFDMLGWGAMEYCCKINKEVEEIKLKH